MKKLGLLAMALALVLTMTQCKKENTTTSNDEGVKVPITLNVSGGHSSRVDVTTETGVVTFENGDVIHVSSNGTYVGTLTYNGTQFAGEINEPTEGQRLQFYFLGNKTPVFNSDNTECSVVISDQTEYLPVISYAPSRENYQVGKTDYNATLLNKCALVRFNVTSASEAATCIVGMNNKVTVDFTDNSFEYSQDGEGVITLPAGNGEKWAILLPQEAMEAGEQGSAYSEDGYYIGTRNAIPTIADNDYLINGIAVMINTSVIPIPPIGAISGLFTINENGDQIYFSQGNLQYQASTNTWQFAEHQYDYIGSANQNISQTNAGWIDMFGWGTSGYNHGAVCYQPWSTSTSMSNYYAYGNWSYNLNDETGKADWGYNAIANGGNEENSGWRTLTYAEWDYVFNIRSTTSGISYAKANVNGVNGVILLPDNWTASIYSLNNSGGYNNNIVTAADWTNVLEINGAVFLPASGSRVGTSIYSDVGNEGRYWSATINDYYGIPNIVHFTNGYFAISIGGNRYFGYSVRLVRNAE